MTLIKQLAFILLLFCGLGVAAFGLYSWAEAGFVMDVKSSTDMTGRSSLWLIAAGSTLTGWSGHQLLLS